LADFGDHLAVLSLAICGSAAETAAIDLESAAFTLHMSAWKPESSGSRELRVLWPLR
jgi:hypothetical protein